MRTAPDDVSMGAEEDTMTSDTQEHTEQVRIPEQPVAAAPDPAPPVDHVRRHGLRCWWNVEECRWDCSGD